MPRGNISLTHGCWQPVPGADGARIWPYLRKVDTVSSNSYLIRSGSLALIIDPGALPGQAAEIAAALCPSVESPPPCVLVLLTHAHIDHFRSLMDHPYFKNRDRVFLAVQEAGARALETADARLTQAALLAQDLVPVRPTFSLFSTPDIQRGGEAQVPYSGGQVRLTTKSRTANDGRFYAEQAIRTDDSCEVILYHTPGHSPDSICIRIGSLLFIGDMLFAAGMGVAGMSGWDRDALISSIDFILMLLQDEPITHCLPGHGKVLARNDAIRVLAGVKKDAAALDGIEELNLSRATETALYAEGVMDEVVGLFSLIAARLLFVSYVLDELEEGGEADTVKKLIDTDRLDALLDDFHRFSDEYHAGGVADIQLALKAGQIVGKLDRMFAQQELSLVLDPEYVRRAARLLCDYTTVLRGFRQPRMLQKVTPAPLVANLVGTLNQSVAGDEDLISSADDPEAFTRALVRKIARAPVFDRISCTCSPESCACTTEADTAILGDVIRAVLEDLAGTGCKEITVNVSSKDRLLVITIEPNVQRIPELPEIRKRFLFSECARAGGNLSWVSEPACIRIDLPESNP